MNSRILGAVLVLTCSATSASAHAFLKRAQPSAGAVLASPPRSIALAFTEKLEPALSGVTVTDGADHNVAAAATLIDGVSMIVPLRPLGRGSYLVRWHAVSDDMHRTEGSYSFTVK